MKKDKILVFVPGYNIANTLEKAISALLEEREKLDFDILYVDNCSEDRSAAIADKLKKSKKIGFLKIIRNPSNLGYGGSQKVAFLHAFDNGYDYLIEYDGDMQYPSERISDLYFEAKKGYSVVFGSRITAKENSREIPKWKYIGNIASNKIINRCLGVMVSEIHTGFRIYDLNRISDVDFTKCHNDYRWTIDSVVEILKVTPRFSEIAIKAYYHKNAKSPKFRQLISTLIYMIFRSIKFRLLKR